MNAVDASTATNQEGTKSGICRLGPWLMAGIACLLYFPFLSIQLNPNGLNEAIAVERGGAALFSPNHMLYCPLAWLIWKFLGILGVATRSVTVLQFTSGFFGVLAAAGITSATVSLSKKPVSSLLAALWITTSCYFWASCTDAFYIAPAVAFVALGAAIVAKFPKDFLPLAGLGLIVAFSILMWQAAVLVLPAFSLALFIGEGKDGVWERLRRCGIFLLSAGGITASTYVLVGFHFFGIASPTDLVEWFTSYGGARLPMWGVWSLDRFSPLFETFVASFVPLQPIGGIPGLWRRFFEQPQYVVLCWFSFFANTSIIAVGVWGLKRRIFRDRDHRIIWPIVGYVTFFPFLLWWDPFEPKWMVVPNAFLALILGCALPQVAKRLKMLIVVTALVLVSASVSFWTTIYPRKTELSGRQRQANCIGSRLSRDDLFIATDWKWNAYLNYFHDVKVMSLIGRARPGVPVESVMAEISNKVSAVRKVGGRCFIVDPESYDPNHLDWLRKQTGLSRGDLARIRGKTVFKCGPYSFIEVSHVE